MKHRQPAPKANRSDSLTFNNLWAERSSPDTCFMVLETKITLFSVCSVQLLMWAGKRSCYKLFKNILQNALRDMD